jgi:uncharacterized membrane protein (Fun14 family)
MGTTPPIRAGYRGGLLFPVLLVALGMMFLLDHLVPGWELHKTWPVLLILIGVFKLVDITRPPRPPEGPRV